MSYFSSSVLQLYYHTIVCHPGRLPLRSQYLIRGHGSVPIFLNSLHNCFCDSPANNCGNAFVERLSKSVHRCPHLYDSSRQGSKDMQKTHSSWKSGSKFDVAGSKPRMAQV